MDWSGIDLLSVKDLSNYFTDQKLDDWAEFVETRAVEDLRTKSESVKNRLQWCKKRPNDVKVNEYDVPHQVAPKKVAIALTDIKVGGRKREPDDKLYNRHRDLREKVARGNTILFVNDLENSSFYYDDAIFALKKFTGGMGDEDEDQPEDNKTWTDYFLKPLSSATKIVCTQKANGEAAHFSVRRIKDQFFVIAGSKNVHLMVRNFSDLDHYTDSRFLVARAVAGAVLDMLMKTEKAKLARLLSFMHWCRLTAVFEVLQPSYQHVVDLSHLNEPELQFITWTLPYDEESANSESYCAFAPDSALKLASEEFDMKCVGHETIPSDDAEARMAQVRAGSGYEGEVFYFMDGKNNVIGLLKKKTAWYVLCRAIREKAAHISSEFRKNPSTFSKNDKIRKIFTRLEQIQKWLGFTDEYLNHWKTLGGEFLSWLISESGALKVGSVDNVRGGFPGMWNKFLEAKNLTDKIDFKLKQL